MNKELEALRGRGELGSSLEAELHLYCSQERMVTLSELGEELKFIFITSSVTLHEAADRPLEAQETSMAGLWIKAARSTHPKCARCWHRREDVEQSGEFEGLCQRCVCNIAAEGEKRLYA